MLTIPTAAAKTGRLPLFALFGTAGLLAACGGAVDDAPAAPVVASGVVTTLRIADCY